jgi:hypothetical protein
MFATVLIAVLLGFCAARLLVQMGDEGSATPVRVPVEGTGDDDVR